MFINTINQCIFPLSLPTLQLFLSGNRLFNIRERFIVNKFVTMIFSGKDRSIPRLMLSNSSFQVIGDTDVKRRVVIAGHYVSVISLVHSSSVFRFVIRFFELRSQNDNPENMATPCSVNTKGLYLTFDPLPVFSKVTNCDLEEINRDLVSSRVNSNMKSGGNLAIFLLTACLSALVSIWYNLARSKSSITLFPRISWIRS